MHWVEKNCEMYKAICFKNKLNMKEIKFNKNL